MSQKDQYGKESLLCQQRSVSPYIHRIYEMKLRPRLNAAWHMRAEIFQNTHSFRAILRGSIIRLTCLSSQLINKCGKIQYKLASEMHSLVLGEFSFTFDGLNNEKETCLA